MEVPANWIGYSLGIASPKLRPVSKVNVVIPPKDWTPDNVTIGPDTHPPAPFHEGLVTTYKDGTRYEVMLSAADAQKIGDELHKRGMDGSSSPGASPTVQKGWSNGVDDRALKSYSSNDWPRDTVGLLFTSGSGSCTATLFSSRLLLTAQHCLWDGKGNFVWPQGFEPGLDGGNYPFPKRSVTQATSDFGWTDNNCGNSTSLSPTCQKYDWSMLLLDASANGEWMGFASGSDSVTASWTNYNLGYPGPSGCGAPAGDQFGTMWGSTGSCATGSFINNLNGANRDFYFGCAISSGHSGGPVYSWSPGNQGPYIVAEVTNETCCGASCRGNRTPNIAFRIDGTTYNTMASWKSTYP